MEVYKIGDIKIVVEMTFRQTNSKINKDLNVVSQQLHTLQWLINYYGCDHKESQKHRNVK